MSDNNIFWVDSTNNQAVSFEHIVDELNKTKSFKQFFVTPSIYNFTLNLIMGVINHKDISILDSSFSFVELDNLGITQEMLVEESEVNVSITDFKHLISKILSSKSSITFYTSGTTGVPKKVEHPISRVLSWIKIGDNYKGNIWGFAYNISHIAGIQVFFQAVMNMNSIINLYSKSSIEIFNLIEKYRVTHLSGTPTFYRLLLNNDKIFPLIQRITIGGEPSNKVLLKKLPVVFPNARINNIYASTEAGTILISTGDTFEIKKENFNDVSIIDNELYISFNLLGKISTTQEEQKWYRTGDRVEILSDNPLRFKIIARTTEMINVGGEKVNPLEIEELIEGLPQVHSCTIKRKENSVIGNIIVAEIVMSATDNITELEIRQYLKGKIQDFKIPRIYRFIDEAKLTRTGKKIRK